MYIYIYMYTTIHIYHITQYSTIQYYTDYAQFMLKSVYSHEHLKVKVDRNLKARFQLRPMGCHPRSGS